MMHWRIEAFRRHRIENRELETQSFSSLYIDYFPIRPPCDICKISILSLYGIGALHFYRTFISSFFRFSRFSKTTVYSVLFYRRGKQN
uniref:Uncharacterized protein n=1 Tax=Ascaris lumbricoides TaxID=6252 RepID=A0A9J2Q6L4_ASCLU